jgi:hypothetical protein
MNKNFLLLVVIISPILLFGQGKNFWGKTTINSISKKNVIDYASKAENPVYFNLDKKMLTTYLDKAPDRFKVSKSSLRIDIPNPGGEMDTFQIYSTPIMAEGLADKYLNIKSLVGYNIKNKAHTLSITITPQGFYGMTLGSEYGQTLINPYDKNADTYIVFSKKDASLKEGNSFECYVDELTNDNDAEEFSIQPKFIEDGVLRRYRLAVASTVEYSDYHLNQAGITSGSSSTTAKATVQAAIVVSINRVNQIFERDFGVTLQLIDNNDQLISLGDTNNDGYTNDDLSELINENKIQIDTKIGFENYDVGHVLCTEGGGLAQTPAVCLSGKARGVTGLNTPVGEYFNIGLLSHELGHQFGANHTQSSDVNENFETAVEPGSGSTIMSYAGVAPPNVQFPSDAMFHYISISEVSNRFITTTGSCAETVSIANEAPVIQAVPNYNIPKNTPFKLEAVATDANTDVLSYSWDQIDNDVVPNVPMPPESTSTSGPSFRTFLPTLSPTRYFPNMPTLLDNQYSNTWEVLPTVARTLNFGVIVRDNNALGGQVAQESTTLTVDDSAGPFRVTSQNTLENIWVANSTKTVTWDVANTDNAAGVNTQNVDILLSTDGGLSFNTVLLANTPNDGSEDIIVPDVVSENSRLMIRASNNVFFDINSQAFSIGVEFTPVYCEAGASDFGFSNIERVVLNSIDNTSPTDNTGYADFTNISTNLYTGDTYPVQVREKNNSVYEGDQVIVWIDFNKNSVFTDSGEKVIETAIFSEDFSIYPFGGNINIPNDAKLGKTTMRIRMNNANFGTSNTTPCGNSTYGEVEDYSVQITSTFNVSTSANPTVGGSTAGGGNIDFGESATVIATANTGYSFVNWTEGGTEVSIDAIFTFTVENNRNLVANFDDFLNVSDFESNSFYIYPNPSSYGQLNIEVDHLKNQKVSLQIYDIIGKQVLNQRPRVNSNGIIQVDASNLASGVYFVKLNHNKKQFVSKWIKR